MTEMSQMSSMSEMSGISTADNPAGDGDNDNTVKFGCLIILLLLALIGVVYFNRGNPAVIGNGGGNGGGGGEESEDNSPPATFVLAKDPPAPTTRFVRKKTTSEGTTSPTPDQFVEPATTKRPTPKALEPYDDVVLCTVSHRALWEQSYPADGVCDQLYYTSIRYYSAVVGFTGAYDDDSFEVFKKKARAAGTSAKTSYGASFTYEDGATAKVYLSKLDTLLNMGIRHYGVLKVADNPDNLTKSNPNLEILKEVKKKQDALRSSKLLHRALGFQVQNRNLTNKTRHVISYVQRNYPITILITVTHTIVKTAWTEGPSSWNTIHSSFVMSLIANEWKAMAQNDNVWILASYTMSAQTWKTSEESGYYGYSDGWWGVIWWNPSLYEQTCIEGGGAVDPTGYYMYKGEWSPKILVTWDSRDTMLKKLKDFLDKVNPLPKKHGWALYDVDYDDPYNKCHQGSFARLQELSRFFRL